MSVYVYKRDYLTKSLKRVNMDSYDLGDDTVYFDSIDEAREDYERMNKDYFCRWEIRRR